MLRARTVQAGWGTLSPATRVRPLDQLRHRIAADADALVDDLATRPGRRPAESLAAEILPLADACRFLTREAPSLLRPRRLGHRGRPVWLFGVEAEVRRDPFGVVLILAPSNYPLLLPGVQAVQALAAGNAVLVKPAPGCTAPMERLADWLADAGVPDGLFQVLGETLAHAEAALDAGPDLVVLTGSAETGRRVQERLAPRLIPSIMELSGSDAVFVLPGADLDLVTRALAFGLRFNGSATCIAPRRVFVPQDLAAGLEWRLAERLTALPTVPVPLPVRHRVARLAADAIAAGARAIGPLPSPETPMAPLALAAARPDMALLSEDLFAPVVALVAVEDMEEALTQAARCPYALGASVFGPEGAARALAARMEAGSVTINDLIAPTADPRLPFGGRRRSGWGVTRGAEGLLEMTRVKTVSRRRRGPHPHFDDPDPGDEALLRGLLGAAHGAGAERRAAWTELARAVWERARRR
ncbi:aldehyde dehydrogenase family protein [Azospirillum sp. RWY-5-1]|uniref:Aldehyde dehydrogenase family protein n=2 Tax=Azospirillum oleiclasticum TaxID=2735135 RepID=A0ABX2T3L9_9PROT|nr:aldehyde dehydrogenase family protein [Azospirillum oleiclasticum]NYZ18430.1 aldehyde dehydrogenase family protein [Azospirillum oleiclasticum]